MKANVSSPVGCDHRARRNLEQGESSLENGYGARGTARPTSWPRVRLGDVCEVRAGADYKCVESPNGRYPIYGTGGEMGRSTKARCPSNSVIVGRKGTLNKPLLIEEPFWNIDTCFGVIPSATILPKYLFAFCQSFDFYSLIPASGRPSTTSNAVRGIEFPLPPLPVQREIVARLERELGAVDKLAKKFEELEAAAEAEFKAELKETFEGNENKIQLGALEDSGRVVLGRGKIISKKDIAAHPGAYPVYSSSATGNGEIGCYGMYMFDDERITWSIDGGGRLFYRKAQRYSVTNVCGWLQVTDSEIETIYLYYALTDAWSKIDYNYTHKAHPSVVRKEYFVAIPSLSIQREIVARLDAAKAKKEKLVAAARRGRETAALMRKAILKEAFEWA